MAEVDIRSLTKRFGDDGGIVAVDDLDLTIEDGEFLVLVGPSGCGKSTTLRCIAGLEGVTEGDIRLGDESIVDRGPADRDIAMVFQNYALYPHMTAQENISFGLRMSTDMSEEAIEERVEDAAETMGIDDLLDQPPGELSGGQQQRVALGRAMVREPSVFLMDEPLSNLDAKLRTQMRTELQNLHQQLGVTTVYVTHDQTEAMTMGDRIAILNGGELQQIGTPLECYHEPANLFVAGFIGSPSMNTFTMTVAGSTLRNDLFEYELPSEALDAVEGTDEVVLGIRPEDIQFADPDAVNTVTTSASVVEPLGDVTYVYFELGDQTYPASVDGDIIVREGDEVTLAFPQDRIHLFDAASGEAIKHRERGATAVNVAKSD
ncbi:ABC transporter ATP-binding protein [Halosimplex amylolyticum]|uniref:ABC transporter ATP-binding protein n=1 Tax=Halosimplex amylolyticum TaxID=3396616 RepID=UPI003F554889